MAGVERMFPILFEWDERKKGDFTKTVQKLMEKDLVRLGGYVTCGGRKYFCVIPEKQCMSGVVIDIVLDSCSAAVHQEPHECIHIALPTWLEMDTVIMDVDGEFYLPPIDERSDLLIADIDRYAQLTHERLEVIYDTYDTQSAHAKKGVKDLIKTLAVEDRDPLANSSLTIDYFQTYGPIWYDDELYEYLIDKYTEMHREWAPPVVALIAEHVKGFKDPVLRRSEFRSYRCILMAFRWAQTVAEVGSGQSDDVAVIEDTGLSHDETDVLVTYNNLMVVRRYGEIQQNWPAMMAAAVDTAFAEDEQLAQGEQFIIDSEVEAALRVRHAMNDVIQQESTLNFAHMFIHYDMRFINRLFGLVTRPAPLGTQQRFSGVEHRAYVNTAKLVYVILGQSLYPFEADQKLARGELLGLLAEVMKPNSEERVAELIRMLAQNEFTGARGQSYSINPQTLLYVASWAGMKTHTPSHHIQGTLKLAVQHAAMMVNRGRSISMNADGFEADCVAECFDNEDAMKKLAGGYTVSDIVPYDGTKVEINSNDTNALQLLAMYASAAAELNEDGASSSWRARARDIVEKWNDMPKLGFSSNLMQHFVIEYQAEPVDFSEYCATGD